MSCGSAVAPTAALLHARQQSDALFAEVSEAAWYERPIPDRHRLIFYLGHVEAFDVNQVRGALGGPGCDAALDRLFERGIDPEPGQAPADTVEDWPDLAKVREYVERAREWVDAHAAQVSRDIGGMMIEHRLMHIETFTYILHNAALERRKVLAPEAGPAMSTAALVEVPRGVATLGAPRGQAFGWDNEFEQHQVTVAGFRIRRYKVTNGEFLEFMRATGASKPHYWFEREGQWWLRGVFDEYLLPLDWPVYAAYEQAQAYAEWSGMSLPSEPQYHRAVEGTDWSAGNFDFRRWDPEPVTATPESASRYGVEQLVGNGWEWTSTVFAPFDGFQIAPTYPGYSADFFDGVHYVMKGAAPRTAAQLVRPSFRNWFRKGYPYMHATFRLVEN